MECHIERLAAQPAAGAPWESYIDGPEVAEPRTLVYLPCKPA